MSVQKKCTVHMSVNVLWKKGRFYVCLFLRYEPVHLWWSLAERLSKYLLAQVFIVFVCTSVIHN